MHRERDVLDLMNCYVEKVNDNLLQRLAPSDNTKDLSKGLCSTFDPFDVRELDQADLTLHLTNIELHYCSGEASFIEPDKLLPEWPVLHSLLLGSYRKYTPLQVCRSITFKHAADFSNFSRLSRLSEAALCICVTSVAGERGFSLQNKLETKARSYLSSGKAHENFCRTRIFCFSICSSCSALEQWQNKKIWCICQTKKRIG